MGNITFNFPDNFRSMNIEWYKTKSLIIKGNSDEKAYIKFNVLHDTPPIVIPTVFSNGSVWGYITIMVADVSTKDCTICMHNLEDINRTVCVGCLIIS